MVRTRLSWAGFGSLGAGLWISPHPDREAEAVEVLREAGPGGGRPRVRGDPVRPGRRADHGGGTAWDLAAIEEQYEQFIEEFRGRGAGRRAGPAGRAGARLAAVPVRSTRSLPRELLPARWSGLTAARLFADRHQRWSDDARLEWKRLNS